jgi:hypothetical protein
MKRLARRETGRLTSRVLWRWFRSSSSTGSATTSPERVASGGPAERKYVKLMELQDVLFETKMPILLLTNQLRWGECESEEAAFHAQLMLADFITIQADLKAHIAALEQILQICEAVATGRYLEDCQRCHWGDHHCEYACTSNERDDGFDDRTPHAAILAWLDNCRPLRAMVKDFIVAQGPMPQKMREGLRMFFPDLKTYKVREDQDGHTVMAEMTPDDQAVYDAEQIRQHASVAQRVEQYELNLQRIRLICQQQGLLTEIITLITEGMPPQIRQPISSS